MRKRLLGKLFSSFIAVIVMSMVTMTYFANQSFETVIKQEIKDDLLVQVEILSDTIKPLLIAEDYDAVAAYIDRLKPLETRYTIVLPAGAVLADTEKDPIKMDNHFDRPEFIIAAKTGVGQSTRFSNTLKKDMLYVAKAQSQDGLLFGYVRAALPLKEIQSLIWGILLKNGWISLLLIALAALISYFISRKWILPITRLTRSAKELATGNTQVRFDADGASESKELADALNNMKNTLQNRVDTLTDETQKKDAILFHMTEGVLLIDCAENIVNMNPVAKQFLDVDKNTPYKGYPLQGIVRNSELARFLTDSLKSQKPIEADVVLNLGKDKHIQCHATPLKDPEGHITGTLIMMIDVTRHKEYAEMRKEFAANVSHELKTPVTLIKGFLETIKESGLDDPKKVDEFISIALHHSKRLNTIIDDLLMLATLESGQRELPIEACNLSEMADRVVDTFRPAADKKQLKISKEGPENIMAQVSPVIFEHVLINLVDNAIKYSENGGQVSIRLSETDSEISLDIKDTGVGIEASHIPRLFERFYRVDPSRSRKEGGTGLGLSIVKHIINLHNGNIAVKSQLGEGTCFTITLGK